MAREGVPLIVIQRRLGHSNLGITPSTSKASTAARSSNRLRPTRVDDPRQHLAAALIGYEFGAARRAKRD